MKIIKKGFVNIQFFSTLILCTAIVVFALCVFKIHSKEVTNTDKYTYTYEIVSDNV